MDEIDTSVVRAKAPAGGEFKRQRGSLNAGPHPLNRIARAPNRWQKQFSGSVVRNPVSALALSTPWTADIQPSDSHQEEAK